MRDTEAEILVLGNQTLGDLEGLLFGQFIELAGTCINGGLYDPNSPHADEDGIRSDALEALRELTPTHIRYPGGCAASYFDWQELVGPKEGRPRGKLFGVTGVAQATAFGIPEALGLCQKLDAELYFTINAHTQTPAEAAALVEYLNGTTRTKWADLRRSHGREEPWGVKYFSLGNEIYGNWQGGQKTAEEYAGWCREAITQMKRVDPSIRVVVCGLGRPDPEWDRTVLFTTIGLADMISVHNYFGRPVFSDSMAAHRICRQMITSTNAIIDEAMDTTLGVHSRTHRELGAPPTVEQRPTIAFDEWNVWYRSTHCAEHDLEEWFTFADALTVAIIQHEILRNTSTIGLSNISLAFNTLGSIMTQPGKLVKQSIWYAQKLLRDAHSGRVVRTVVDAPSFSAKHERFFCGNVSPEKALDPSLPSLQHFDDIAAIDALLSVDDEKRTASLSVVQKLEDRALDVSLRFRGLSPKGNSMRITSLTGKTIGSINTFEEPKEVGMQTTSEPLSETYSFPPASLTVLTFDL